MNVTYICFFNLNGLRLISNFLLQIMLGMATLALVLANADPEPGYGYRRYGYKPRYGGYRKYSPRYYGRKYYHNKGYAPYPYHKGYPAGVPEVVDPLPHEVRELPTASVPYGAVPLSVEGAPVPVEPVVPVGNAIPEPAPVPAASAAEPAPVPASVPVPAPQALPVQPKQEPVAIGKI